jgi:hypothetical protein
MSTSSCRPVAAAASSRATEASNLLARVLNSSLDEALALLSGAAAEIELVKAGLIAYVRVSTFGRTMWPFRLR